MSTTTHTKGIDMTTQRIPVACEYADAIGGGSYNETIVTLSDGSRAAVIPQYGCVLPLKSHADTCEQGTKLGGRCTCGGLDGLDVKAVIAYAIAGNKFGRAPKAAVHAETEVKHVHGAGWCTKCQSECYGDCAANS